MAKLEVREIPGSGNRYRMEIYHEGTHIGDYEESEEQNLPRKRREIERCADFLLDTYAEYGKFLVRWTAKGKEIREYQEEGNNPAHPIVPLGFVIPTECWKGA